MDQLSDLLPGVLYVSNAGETSATGSHPMLWEYFLIYDNAKARN